MQSTPKPLRPPKRCAEETNATSQCSAEKGSSGSKTTASSRIPSLEKRGKRLTSLSSLNHSLSAFNRRVSSQISNRRGELPLKNHTANVGQEKDPTGLGGVATWKESSFVEDIPEPTSKETASRRSSWLPIPEKSSRPLPRSLTLGDLSRPARSRREDAISQDVAEQADVATKSGLFASNQSGLRSKIPSAPRGILKSSRPVKMQRSDTEPLLPVEGGDTPTQKENVSPIFDHAIDGAAVVDHDKPLPPSPVRSRRESGVKSPASYFNKASRPRDDMTKPRLINIPKRALPRFSTQPNLGSSLKPPPIKTEVKHHTLLSPKQAPTPVPRSPLQSIATNLQRTRTPRPHAIYEEDLAFFTPPSITPSNEPPYGTDHTPAESTLDRSPSYNPETVTSSEPLPYWCGRFLSQHDRLRSAAFEQACAKGDSVIDTADERHDRYRLILGKLYAACEGDDAIASLQVFHAYLRTMHVNLAVGEEETIAARLGWTEVREAGEEVKRASISGADSVASGNRFGAGKSLKSFVGGRSQAGRLSVGRRGTFMERLLGRGRKSVV